MEPDTRFLLVSGAGALAAADAWRPLHRRGVEAGLSFGTALVASELPLQAMAVQALAGAAFARGGGARGLRGALGLGLAGVSLVRLWQLHRAAGQAGDVLEVALREGLGDDYRSRIAEPFSPRPDVPLTRRSLLLPDLRGSARYLAARDLPYGDFGRHNHLDVMRRADLPSDARAPVLLQIHGGAWVFGQKRGQAEPLMAHLAERGWVCVAINYRLSPRATWPDHIVDVKRALAWTRATIAGHGGDPDFIVVTGGSAGGHLAALAALTPGLPDFQPGFEDADTRVAAAVPFYGVYDFTNRDGTASRTLGPFLERQVLKTSLSADRVRWEQASPMSHVGPDAPPFFVLHGANDTIVPVEQARSFAALLRAASRQAVAYAELPHAHHVFDLFPSVRTRQVVHAVERFLAVVRSEQGGATPAEAVVSDRV